MTYDYECIKCRKVTEHSCKLADKPASIECDCKGTAWPVILTTVPASFPQGRSKGGYMRPDIGGRRHQKFF